MKHSIVLANPEFLAGVEIARQAEAHGFHRVWTTENPGRDALVRALTIALRTDTINVASGIAYAFTRAPLGLAATAADIQVASQGRFSLGLGAGTQGMRRTWYGIEDFDHPASRLAEYAQLMRAAWRSATDFRHEGRFYRGDYHQLDGVRPATLIWGSGINATMLTVAARHFDGVALHALGSHLDYLDRVVRPAVAPAGNLPLAAWRMVSIDPDGTAARTRAAMSLAFYFTTPSYGTVADETGWSDAAAKIRAAFKAGGPDWEGLGALVPAPMLDEFCLAGNASDVRAQWTALEPEFSRRGITEVVFQTAAPGSDPENLSRIVEVLGA
jgi:alkanesulfonate monooxygenase SsuD/methylene tetrahydromethanopterin reductase-like flavin-dependent oxidoreductase (luciferase family)